jgi:putative heme transporter
VLALIVYAVITLRIVFIPVIIAIIVACAARPVVTWLERHGWPSGLATIVTLVLGVAVLGGLVTGVVFGVRSQWDTLVDSVQSGVQELTSYVQDLLQGGLPFGITQQQVDDTLDQVTSFLTSSQFGSGAIAGVATVFEVVAGFVLGIFVLFFLMKDGPRIWQFLLQPFDDATTARLQRVGIASAKVLGGYVRGTSIVALVDAVFIGIGLLVIGSPLALPLAAIVFIGAFIPIVGATAAGTIAALVTLVTNDLQAAIIVAIIVIAVNQLEGNLLQPVVLGGALKLHELVVLLALTAGTVLGGIVGTLLSVPIAAVVWAATKAWFTAPEAPPNPVNPGPVTRVKRSIRSRLFAGRRARA